MTKNTNVKLLLLNDSILYSQDTAYFSKSDTFLQFICYLKDHFYNVTICSPVLTTNTVTESWFRIPIDETNKITIQKSFPYLSVVDYYKKLPLIFLYNLPVFIKAIKKADMILLITSGMNSFMIAFLAKLYGKPIFTYFVGDQRSIVRKGSKYKGIRLVIAQLIANFHVFLHKRIVSISKASFFISSDLERRLGKYNNNSFIVIASLVNENDISIDNSPHTDTDTRLLYVGRLSHEKGLDCLIQALPYLVKENNRLTLSICGDGPETKRLRILVERLGMTDYVNFHGFVPWGEKLSKIYLDSDIFILPSLSEGVPKVLLEAMASGIPIIATNVGGIPDIINDLENGILVPPGNSEAIADAVKMIIKNNSLQKKLIRNGYDFIREHTAGKQAGKIAELMYRYS